MRPRRIQLDGYSDNPRLPAPNPATSNQLRCLEEMQIPWEPGITSYDAYLLIRENNDRWCKLPITAAQESILIKHGRLKPGMNRGEATAIINVLRNGR